MSDDRMPEVANGLAGRGARIGHVVGVVGLSDMDQRIEVGMFLLAHREST
jgi:hypothetical protein